MLSNRSFEVYLIGYMSQTTILNNGLPLASVLAPLLNNVYTSCLPTTNACKFCYADDMPLAVQCGSIKEYINTLNQDIKVMEKYFSC